jgi:hypothetical protein
LTNYLPLIPPSSDGMSVAIIPCTNQKSDVAGPAREVWAGAHFQLVLAHAEIHFDWTYVMSYKYGLITPDQLIEPYDLNIKNAAMREKLEWWLKLRTHIAEAAATKPRIVGVFTGNFERDRFIREWVRNGVRNVLVPWQGLGIGQRIQQVYDGISPYSEEKLAAGEYELDENWGESVIKNMKELAQQRQADKRASLEEGFQEEEEWVE